MTVPGQGEVMLQNIQEICEYRDMIASLVRRELRGKYEKSVLGFLWAFLSPLFQILIYSVVFTVVFHNSMENYYIFLMTGMLPWTFFSDSLSQGTGSIVYNSEMVKKIYFPREVLVIGEVTAKLVNMLLSFLVMAAFLVVSGIGFSVQLVLLPAIVAAEYLFALGLAFLVACTTVYLRDLEYVINVILMAWVWASPIMYTVDGIDNRAFLCFISVNPFTYICGVYQKIFYFHEWPAMYEVMIPFIEGIIVLIIGFIVFGRCKRRFAEEL